MSAGARVTPSASEPSVGVAVLGAGRLGAKLVSRLLDASPPLRLELVADLRDDAEGMRLARETGIATSGDGISGVLRHPGVRLVFDASCARAHARHAPALRQAGKATVDLTPAGAGPVIVPAVNLPDRLAGFEVCLVSSAAQAAVPIAAAVRRCARTPYFEAVTTVSSSTLGRGTRSNVDELVVQSGRALEGPGGAAQGKAILIVSPADPPPLMRCTLYAPLEDGFDEVRLRESIQQAVGEVQRYAPGYRLRHDPEVSSRDTPQGRKPVLEVMLEVEGSRGSPWAGNLELMACAAEVVGSHLAGLLLGAREVVA